MAATRTIRVTLKDQQDRGEIVINESAFNPEVHQKVDGSEYVAPAVPISAPGANLPPRASDLSILQAYDLPPNHDPARGKPDDLRRLEEATPAHLRPQPLPHPAVLPDPGALRANATVDQNGNVSAPGMAANPTATGTDASNASGLVPRPVNGETPASTLQSPAPAAQ